MFKQLFSCILLLISFAAYAQQKGTVRFRFVNTANSKPVVVRDSAYSNVHNEEYTISKLKYYISNIFFPGNSPLEFNDNYQLVDAAKSTSFDIPVSPGKYEQFSFMVGIDSTKHFSGAQEGVLDPMMDMFWTWNSGYVIFKMEGTSTASTADRNRIEHHVGGYRFGNIASKTLYMAFVKEPLIVEQAKTAEVTIFMDLDKYWASVNTVRIKEDPVCTLPGALANRISENFASMFSVGNIKYLEN